MMQKLGLTGKVITILFSLVALAVVEAENVPHHASHGMETESREPICPLLPRYPSPPCAFQTVDHPVVLDFAPTGSREVGRITVIDDDVTIIQNGDGTIIHNGDSVSEGQRNVTVHLPGFHEVKVKTFCEGGGREREDRFTFVILDSVLGEDRWGLPLFSPPYPPHLPPTIQTALSGQLPLSYLAVRYPRQLPAGVPLSIAVRILDASDSNRLYRGEIELAVTITRSNRHVRCKATVGVCVFELPPLELPSCLDGEDDDCSRQHRFIVQAASNPSQYPLLSKEFEIEVIDEVGHEHDEAELNADHEWKGLVHITKSMTIQRGNTVKVHAGAIILLGDGVTIYNRGRLVIEGTETRPVYMSSTCEDALWGGIVATASGAAEINHALFVGVGRASCMESPEECDNPAGGNVSPPLQVVGGSSLQLRDVTVIGHEESDMGMFCDKSTVSAHDTHFTSFERGVRGVDCELDFTTVHLEGVKEKRERNGTLFDASAYGISINGGDLTARELSIVASKGSGVSVLPEQTKVDISDSWFDSNWGDAVGVECFGVRTTVRIDNSVFMQNSQGVALGGSAHSCVVDCSHSLFVHNDVGVRLGSGSKLPVDGYVKVEESAFMSNRVDVMSLIRRTGKEGIKDQLHVEGSTLATEIEPDAFDPHLGIDSWQNVVDRDFNLTPNLSLEGSSSGLRHKPAVTSSILAMSQTVSHVGLRESLHEQEGGEASRFLPGVFVGGGIVVVTVWASVVLFRQMRRRQ